MRGGRVGLGEGKYNEDRESRVRGVEGKYNEGRGGRGGKK